MLITSVNNERVKNLSKLHLKKYRDIENSFLIEGDHLIEEALKKSLVKEIFLLDGESNPFDFDNVTYVTKEVMDKLSEQDSSSNMIALCDYLNNCNIGNKVLLLDGLQDPGNVGTIIRSAVAFGFDIVLGNNTVDIYNSKTIRSTEGMIFNVNFIKCDLIKFIKENDYNYFIADMNNGKEIKTLTNINRVGIIMGNEGNGVSDEVRSLDIPYVHIKQNSICESLNVGVAASILMYELGDGYE